jgi:hypothetical protein
MGSQLWADTDSGAEFGVVTGLSYLPGLVSIRSLTDVKGELLAQGEIKSESSNGESAGARSSQASPHLASGSRAD